MKNSLIALIFSCFLASNALAGNIGNSVQLKWSANNNDYIEIVTVGPGIELPFWIAGSWDFGDDYIEYKSGSLFGDSEIYGFGKGVNWVFDGLDLSNTQSISAITNFEGWDENYITFNKNSISISYANEISFAPNEGFLKLTFIPTTSTIPEPNNSSLLCLGLLMIFFISKQKSRTLIC